VRRILAYRVAALFFLFTVIVLPGLPDGGETPRWVVLSIMLPAMFLWRSLFPNATCLLLLVYLALMASVTPVWQEAAYIYWHFLLYVAAFYLFRNELKQAVIGGSLALTVNSCAAIAQLYGWAGIPELAANSGIFFNRNIASEAAAMLVVMALGYRMWWLVPGMLPTLYLGSRAPIIAMGVAGLLALWRRAWWQAAAAVVAAGGMVVAISPGLSTLEQRFGAWHDALHGLTFWGRGLGSFIVEFPLFQRSTDPLFWRFENAHNDALQVVFELGLPGAVLLAMVIWRMATVPRSPAWYGLVVFMVEGCFGFPLYKPVTGILAACCAGIVLGGWNPLRGLRRAVGLVLWAGLAYWIVGRLPAFVESFPADPLPSRGARLLGWAARLRPWGDADKRGSENRSLRGGPALQPRPATVAKS